MDAQAEDVGRKVMDAEIVGEEENVSAVDILGVAMAVIRIVAENDSFMEAVALTITNCSCRYYSYIYNSHAFSSSHYGCERRALNKTPHSLRNS